MTHETDKQRAAIDDPLDVEYRELMKLAGPDGCKCGVPHCPGHEVIDGRIVIENHPLGTVIIECPDKDSPPLESSSKKPFKK